MADTTPTGEEIASSDRDADVHVEAGTEWFDPNHRADMVRFLLAGTIGAAVNEAGSAGPTMVDAADKVEIDRICGNMKRMTQQAAADAASLHGKGKLKDPGAICMSVGEMCLKGAAKIRTAVREAAVQSRVAAEVLRRIEDSLANIDRIPSEDRVMALMDNVDAADAWGGQFVAIPEPEVVVAAPAPAPASAKVTTSPGPETHVDPNAWKLLPTWPEQLHGHLAWKPMPAATLRAKMKPFLSELRALWIEKALGVSLYSVQEFTRTASGTLKKSKFDQHKFRRTYSQMMAPLEQEVAAWVEKALPSEIIEDRFQFSRAVSHFMAGIQSVMGKNTMIVGFDMRDITELSVSFSRRLRQSALSAGGNMPSERFALAPEEQHLMKAYMISEIFTQAQNGIAGDIVANEAPLQAEALAADPDNPEGHLRNSNLLMLAMMSFHSRLPLMQMHNLDCLLHALDTIEISINAVLGGLPGGIERYPLLRGIVEPQLEFVRDAMLAAYLAAVQLRDSSGSPQ